MIGWIVPTSLLASIMLTNPVSSLTNFRIESMSTVPSSSTEAREDVIPKDLILFITLITAGCSIDDAIMCFLSFSIEFHSTWLFASVPPLVKNI